MTTLAEKQHALDLIERLEAPQLTTAVRFLEFLLLSPVARSIATAPMDEEPTTEEEVQATAASQEWFHHHQGIPHEVVLAEFGLRPEEFPWNVDTAGQTRR